MKPAQAMVVGDLPFPIVAILLVLVVGLWYTVLNRRRLPLPPGPMRLPVLGNIFNMPSAIPSGEKYYELTKKYGDVVYISVPGNRLVILGSYDAASELLDKRSSNYSDRPQPVMTDLLGAGWALIFNRYGDLWRRRRRDFHHFFGSQSIAQYQHVQEDAARLLLRLLTHNPEAFWDHTRFVFGSTILRIVYGIKPANPRDEYVSLAEASVKILDKAYTPGKYLVEVFPFLKYVPQWMPGAQFKRDVAAWKVTIADTRNKLFDAALQFMRRGNSQPCIVSTMVEQSHAKGEWSPDSDEHARDVSGIAYLGGVDTLVASFQTFLLAMAMYPAVQRKAQAELDAVVGEDRLPRLSDRDSLPYINALYNEVLRWKVVGQLAFPHQSLEDDEYNGYLIPKGTVLLANVWAISRDPKQYPDPDRFMPERFLKDGKLNPDVRNPRAFAFGFGRRSCAGKHFAEPSLFIAMASVLHALVVDPPLDERGSPRVLTYADIKMVQSFVAHPEPLQYRFRPRTRAMQALVLADIANEAEAGSGL
ncbi:cytochrome P450 [Ganoderma leucocontextum]|nr:cytochrome P450 [Ganoderma leucocontextum]